MSKLKTNEVVLISPNDRQGICNNYAQYQDENNNWVTFYSLGANGLAQLL